MEVGAEVCTFWILEPKGRCVCVCVRYETRGRRYVGDSQILGHLFFWGRHQKDLSVLRSTVGFPHVVAPPYGTANNQPQTLSP